MIKLKLRRYFISQVVIPLMIIFITWPVLYLFPEVLTSSLSKNRMISVFLLVLAAVTGLGLPLLTRSIFAYRNRNKDSLTKDEYYRFDKKLILLSVCPLYIVSLALAFGVANFYLYSITLIAIYSGYAYYPSDKRISMDQKIFRIHIQEM